MSSNSSGVITVIFRLILLGKSWTFLSPCYRLNSTVTDVQGEATRLGMLSIIIIMLHHQHGSPWPFSATLLYRPGGLQGYILYRHRAGVYRFELVVLLLLVHMRGPQEYDTYEFVPNSVAVSRLSILCLNKGNSCQMFSVYKYTNIHIYIYTNIQSAKADLGIF